MADLDWVEIRRLDAGIRCGEAWRGVRVPRLEEVLDLTDGRVGLNVHLKDEGPGGATVRRVCDLLTEHALTGIAYVALGTEPALRTALAYAQEVPRACLVRQRDPRDVGLICNLFWSDDPQEAMAYVQRGIDVILTNCAHTLIAGGFEGLVWG